MLLREKKIYIYTYLIITTSTAVTQFWCLLLYLMYKVKKTTVILHQCSDSTCTDITLFKGALTNSCTFACAWYVCVTCVASLLPSHYQALLWPSHTSQPLQYTWVVANALFQWTWELMNQGSWYAWDTVGRQHCSVLQWSVCTRIPAVRHCESEPQEDILEKQPKT